MSDDLTADRAANWRATQREARDRVEASPQAAAAVQKLLAAGIRESDVWQVLSGALLMKRTLGDVVEEQQLQYERERMADASRALAVLAEFVDEALANWPSLFSPELMDISPDRIVDAFGDIGHIMQTRAFLTERHRALLGAAGSAGQDDNPEDRQRAAMRLAIGEIAYWVHQLDPKHASHAHEVVKISKALLGGDVLAKDLVAYRGMRGELEPDREETRPAKIGFTLTLPDMRDREPHAENES